MRGVIPILRVGGVLLVTVQTELRDTVADAFQQDLLEAIDRHAAKGLVVDISALEIVDTYVARVLVDTGRMARLMGTRTIVVGMRPEVASTLVNMGFFLSDVETALDVDDGLMLLGRAPGQGAV
jgi:rsbT antagonist protein RsbS